MTDREEESRSLAELYAAVRAEGGKLTVYAGGDFAMQQDGTANAFRAEFPAIDFQVVVDYSKYHNMRIDRQLRDDDLIPDVAHLQTTFDFDRWKERGVLMQYRPAGFAQVYEGFKDPDGHFVAIGTFAFSFMHGPNGGPATPKDLTDPQWRGKIVSAFPQDDDATLFLFKKYVDVYGWEWLDALAGQKLNFRRGTNSPGDAVSAGEARVGIGGYDTGAAGLTWVVPQSEHPFFAWGQRAAIFRETKHPEAAKLYLNWLLSESNQRNAFNGWSVRKDIVPKGGRCGRFRMRTSMSSSGSWRTGPWSSGGARPWSCIWVKSGASLRRAGSACARQNSGVRPRPAARSVRPQGCGFANHRQGQHKQGISASQAWHRG